MKTILAAGILACALALTACAVSPMANLSSSAVNSSPFVTSTYPENDATNAYINKSITVVFNKEMSASSINPMTFVVMQGTNAVTGTVTYAGNVATFTSPVNLAADTTYSVTITTDAKDLANNPLFVKKIFSFTTGSDTSYGPNVVNLGAAGSLVILAKSGISTVPDSIINGDIGVSPAAATYITGFSLVMDAGNTFSLSSQVNGKVYAADYADTTPAFLVTAVNDMVTAFNDAAGRTTPDFKNYGGGNISDATLSPGLYKWNTGVVMNSDVILNGSTNDVWIFQISGGITMAAGVKIHLTGGAQSKNVFWQTTGVVTLNEDAHIMGIVLSKTAITLATGASANGRLLAQTAVTMDQCTISKPN